MGGCSSTDVSLANKTHGVRGAAKNLRHTHPHVVILCSVIDTSTRINKYIGESGLYSRKAADRLVSRGVVFINQERAKLGDKVSVGDTVLVNGEPVVPLTDDESIVVLLNKPVGVVCTAAKTDKRNIVDFVNYGSRLLPVGRLDKDSQGLILLTNRGELANQILNTGNRHEKEYVVTVNRPITDALITGICNGVPMLGVTTQPCKALRESEYVFRITLRQGLNRQIRRMCKHFNYSVERLERTRIMHIELNALPLGEWRVLNPTERIRLFQAADMLGSESEAPVT